MVFCRPRRAKAIYRKLRGAKKRKGRKILALRAAPKDQKRGPIPGFKSQIKRKTWSIREKGEGLSRV